MEIVYTQLAQADLAHALRYLMAENPHGARLVLDRIETAFKLLADQPEMGRPGRIPHTRELYVPNTPFIVPYQIREGRLVILRVFHAARRWPPGEGQSR